MDLSNMLRERLPGGGLQDSTLRKLTEDAGEREESWERTEELVQGECYICPSDELHRNIVDKFKKTYGRVLREWATDQNLTIVKIHVRHPTLLKKGSAPTSIVTSSGTFAVFIPFPFRFKHCEVLYQPNKDDPTTQEPIGWLDPVLLPENSAIVLLDGEIKFQLVIFDCEVAGVRDHDSKVDGKNIREE